MYFKYVKFSPFTNLTVHRALSRQCRGKQCVFLLQTFDSTKNCLDEISNQPPPFKTFNYSSKHQFKPLPLLNL